VGPILGGVREVPFCGLFVEGYMNVAGTLASNTGLCAADRRKTLQPLRPALPHSAAVVHAAVPTVLGLFFMPVMSCPAPSSRDSWVLTLL
jgi:hypothetical protein